MSGNRLCPAGHSYWWPGAKWQHEACVSPAVPSRATSDSQPPADVANVSNTVVDTALRANAAVVDARTRDRHRKTKERREYLKLAQRRSRAARRVSGAAT